LQERLDGCGRLGCIELRADNFLPDQQVYGAGSASVFAAPVAEDEASFSVVSNVRDSGKTRFGRGAVFTRGGRGQRGDRGGGRAGGRQTLGRGGRGNYGGFEGRGGGRGNAGARGRRFGWKDYDKPARNRDASVNIKADWKLLEEIDFNRLSKLNLDTDEGEDIDSYGFIYPYDRSYDKPQVKATERKLNVLDRAAYNVTTSSDPVIQELAEKDEATIFATDNILSMLMCAPRSVYPWDIVIVRQGNKIFLDKRENAALDMVTVNENAADAPMDASEGSKDVINQPAALAEEATYINHNFANQVVIENESQKVEMAHENPFYNPAEETEPPASKAYKYRRFDLSTNEEEPVYLVVRTELDAAQRNATNGEDQFVTVHALNEFDSKAQGSGGALDWRSKLVSQRGAVVATEMKNNSVKLARWTVQSILAKADVMKLGCVFLSPSPFSQQISLTVSSQLRLPRQPQEERPTRRPGRRGLEAARLRQPDEPVAVQRLGHRAYHRRHVPEARRRPVRAGQGPQQVHPPPVRGARRQLRRGRRGGRRC
jgi:translation initiation factor 3 subunit D